MFTPTIALPQAELPLIDLSQIELAPVDLSQVDLATAIAPPPLTIAPTALAIDAMALMHTESSTRDLTCDLTCEESAASPRRLAQQSCLLVLEGNHLVGIVTERDLVHLSAAGRNLAEVAIAEIMSSPVQTLATAEFTDLFVPLNLLQRHAIGHLPLVDDQGAVVGLLTRDSLSNLLGSFNLLHLPTAAEVMTQTVIQAPATAPLRELTQLMTTHRVSSVVIVEERQQEPEFGSQEPLRQNSDSRILAPLGIVTERDILYFLALEMDFATVQAQAIMSPIGAVGKEASLWQVWQLMQERQLHQVAVTSPDGALVGIVTLTTLLSLLNPMEIYRMAERLLRESQSRERAIKEHQQTEAALREAQVELQHLFASMKDYIFILNWEGRYLKAALNHSDSASKVNQTLHQVFPPAIADHFLATIHTVLATQQSTQLEYCLPIQGKELWFSTIVSPLNAESVLWVARDISDRKAAEFMLNQYKQVVFTLKDGVSLIDRNYIYRLVNPVYLERTQKKWEDIIGHSVEALHGKATFQTLMQPRLDRCLAGEVQEYEDWFDFLGSGRRFISVTYFPYSELDGTISGVVVTTHDRTALQQATQALEQLNQELEHRVAERTAALQTSEERFRNAFDTSAMGMCLVSLEGRYLRANPSLCNFLGYGETELLELRFQDITHPDDLTVNLEFARRIRAGEIHSYHLEKRYVTKRGKWVWGLLSVSLVRDAHEQPLHFVAQIQDITDRKQAEFALQESQRFIQQIADASPNILYVYDLQEQRNIYANQEITAILGYTPKEIQAMGSSFAQNLLHPDDLSFVLPVHYGNINAAQDGEIIETEYRMKHANGEWRWLYSRDSIFSRDADGQAKRTIGTAQDITERKQAEQSLREAQQFIQTVINTVPLPLFWKNRESVFLGCNLQLAASLDMTSTREIVGKTDFDLSPTEAQAIAYRSSDQRVMASGEPILGIEETLILPNGEQRWLETHKAPLRDWTDTVVGVVGMFQDITERKYLEREQNRLLAILEASTDYILIADMVGNTIWNNTALRQLRRLEEDAIVLQQKPLNYHPQWAVEMLEQQAIPIAIAQGSWLGENILLDAEGQEIPVSQLVLAHKSSQGEVEFFSTIMRDMRVHKEYERRLEQTNAELLRATRLKDEFLANMSHELRTPLNAILGMSETLLEEMFGALNERQKNALATVESSGRHLLLLINDILDVSKIEAGKLELEIAPTSIAHLCASSLPFVKQQALKKQIQLHTNLPANLGEIVVDERRIRQALINLLSNAVKFTPAGGRVVLEVSIQRIGSPEAERSQEPEAKSQNASCDASVMQELQDDPEILEADSWILFSVTDTGIGIAAADQPKLFQPFIQLDSSLNRRYEGTGLGLTLVKQIVELHGGSVSLTSQLGQGSCFTICLPYGRSGGNRNVRVNRDSHRPVMSFSNALTSEPTEAIAPPLILLAEDNEANSSTLSSYLTAKGHQILLAYNGQEAIDLAQTRYPDLIVMDVQMPEMNGLEAIRQIRTHLPDTTIPIIVLTALAMESDRQKCLDAGANAYLAKPVRLKELFQVIQTLLAL